MAVSKNNRRKGKKRTKAHASPVRQGEEKQESKYGGYDWFSMAGLAIMLAGFLGAMFTQYGLVFYPITFVGAVMGLVRTRWDTWPHKVTVICYIVYCIAVAGMWIGMLTGRVS